MSMINDCGFMMKSLKGTNLHCITIGFSLQPTRLFQINCTPPWKYNIGSTVCSKW